MWVFAVKENEVEDNRINRIYPKGIAVLLIKKDGEMHAVSARCPHMSCSLGDAKLEGNIITCPCHDWRFDIVTGEFLDANEIKLKTYEVKIEDGDVLVRLDEVVR